jgi:ribonuclease HI
MEWMPKWKTNGWKNSKRAGIANKSLWLALDEVIGLHGRVEFSWVKAHSGPIHNEIADELATRGVKGWSYCRRTDLTSYHLTGNRRMFLGSA